MLLDIRRKHQVISCNQIPVEQNLLYPNILPS
nr:MAG TPA: hypothetical protein [Caudoviricetes sp.]